MLISYIIMIIGLIYTIISISYSAERSPMKGIIITILMEIAGGLLLAVIWIIMEL